MCGYVGALMAFFPVLYSQSVFLPFLTSITRGLDENEDQRELSDTRSNNRDARRGEGI